MAFVLLQLSMETPLLAIDAGVAVNNIVGAGGTTITVAEALEVPPAPVQASVKLLLVASAPVDSDPFVAFVPVHAPEAMQLVALVLSHRSIELPLGPIDAGLAERLIVGVGVTTTLLTTTSTELCTLPPAPVHVRRNVEVAANAPLDSEPLIALLPVHAPEAVHEVAFVVDQVSTLAVPAVTVVGVAENKRVGAGAGAATLTVTDLVVVPPPPVQVSVYVLAAVSALVDSVPVVALLPDHVPDAAQLVASVELQESNEVPELATVAGSAVSVMAGAFGVPGFFSVVSAPPPQPARSRVVKTSETIAGERALNERNILIRIPGRSSVRCVVSTFAAKSALCLRLTTHRRLPDFVRQNAPA
ncbi:MAG: hypothetical protein WDO56_21545 [Gammaproteobacteria bacterium]